MENKGIEAYNDIIELPHHVSDKHPQMSLDKRAAQFAPYAALTGFEAAISETERIWEQMVENEILHENPDGDF